MFLRKKSSEHFFKTCLPFLDRDNILVLDIFFEALNYETIEQKKAYEIAGLLGMLLHHVYDHYLNINKTSQYLAHGYLYWTADSSVMVENTI